MPNPHLIEPSPDGLHWYALKVFYNRVVFLKSLLPDGMESYVPVHTVEKHDRGQLAYEEESLIPSLLFVRCEEKWLVNFKHDHNGDFMYYTAAGTSKLRPSGVCTSKRMFCVESSTDSTSPMI